MIATKSNSNNNNNNNNNKMMATALLMFVMATTATAFVPSHQVHTAAAFTATRRQNSAIRDGMPPARTRGERAGSFNVGDVTMPSTTTTRSSSSWLRPPATKIAPAQREKADLSKLFATPEPETGSIARAVRKGAQSSCGSFPIFFAMCALCAKFSPVVAAQSVAVWGVGRVGYWWTMRKADVSRRLHAGLVGYMALFLFLGGLSFLNGLKAVALLA